MYWTLDYCNAQLGPGQGESFLVNSSDSSRAVQPPIAEVTSQHSAAQMHVSEKSATAKLTEICLYMCKVQYLILFKPLTQTLATAQS